jgi:hypothetical protein
LAIFTVINGVLLRPLEDRGLTTPGRFNYNYGIQEKYRLKNSGRRVPNRTGLEQKNVRQKNQASQVERYFSARHFSAAPNF